MKKVVLLITIIFSYFILINNVYAEDIKISYTTHVQSYGWQDYVSDGELAGTQGQAKRLEGIKINLSENLNGNVEYITYVQSYGWEENWKANGELSGTEGQAKRLEAIKIRLTGEVANQYDIYYRVHSQTYGWLSWAKNSETAGTIGLGKRLEGIEIKIVEKGSGEETNNSYVINNDILSYQGHSQSYGWLPANQGNIIGVTGEAKRLEGYRLMISPGDYAGGIEYISSVENKGWESEWKRNNQISGTIGEAKRLEQVKIRLTGDIAEHYDIYYRAHVQGFGWLGWAKNGEAAGVEDLPLRLEAIEIKLVEKGTGEETGNSLEKKNAKVTYSAHVRSIGDMPAVSEGETIGTTGRNLRMEALTINLDSSIAGNILYKTYVDNVGWEENYRSSGELSGTVGEAKAIQLLRIKLDGDLAEQYDVYYRVHTETYGWLGWAKNDEITGADCYDIQAIEIRLYLKIDRSYELLDRDKIHIETGFYKENGYTYYRDKNGNQATDWIRIMNKKYFFNSKGIMIGKNVKKVIDVSAYQGDIDWDTVNAKADIDGVILRLSAGAEYEDRKLARNISELKRLGIPYGVYIYSYAETYEEGKYYGDFTVDLLKKYDMNPTIGIFLDLENNYVTSYMGVSEYERVVTGYMEVLTKNGYGDKTKIYTYKSYADTKLNSSYLRNQITWIAQYYHFCTYSGSYVGWQYSSSEYIPGIEGNVDASVWFTNF